MSDALKKLIEAVEAGSFDAKPGSAKAPPFNKFMDSAEDALPRNVTGCNVLAWEAYHGSLDAAKALHDSLLPGWSANIWTMPDEDADVTLRPAIAGPIADQNRDIRAEVSGDRPARAWLLAILKAKLQEDQP